MNILFIAYNVNIQSRTGDAVHVRELVSNMAAMGNKISLVVGFDASFKEDISSLEKDPNINVHYIKTSVYKNPRFKDISILSLCINLAKKNRPNIIYERNFSCRIGSLLSIILKIPLIIEINGILDEEIEMQERYFTLKRSIIEKEFKKLFYKQANRIIVVSPGIKEGLIRKYNIRDEKISVIANGANVNIFRPVDKKEAQNKLHLPQNYKYICFVGNLMPWQGIEYLINAASLILVKNPDLKFLIVGDGMMKNKWKKMVEDKNLSNNFMFTGSVPFEEVPLYINSSDFCVAIFNNKRKCSPLKVFEYLACGKPVILSNIGSDTEIFTACRSVFLVNLESLNKFADELNEIISNKNSEQTSISAREFILENYTWKNTAKKVLEICSEEIAIQKPY